MTIEMLINFLRENLKVNLDSNLDYDGESKLTVTLLLGDEVISKSECTVVEREPYDG